MSRVLVKTIYILCFFIILNLFSLGKDNEKKIEDYSIIY